MATQIPVVMIPRYTTFAGTGMFTTVAMDVLRFGAARMDVWRGKLVTATPASASAEFMLEESSDAQSWQPCEGNPTPVDPGEEAEASIGVTLRQRWFRVIFLVDSTASEEPVVTAYAAGVVARRET